MKKMLSIFFVCPLFVLAQRVGLNTENPLGDLHISHNGAPVLVLELAAETPVFTPFIRGGGYNLVLNARDNGNFFCGEGAGNSCIGTANIGVGKYSASITTGQDNTAFGDRSLMTNGTASYNSGLGAVSVRNGMMYNTGAGYACMPAAIGSYNTGIGSRALNYTSSAMSGNVAIGYQSLNGSTVSADNTGSNNMAIGRRSLYNNSMGFDMTAIGNSTLELNTMGNNLIAVGANAMYYNVSGAFNTAVGKQSLEFNSTGNYNTGVGYLSLHLSNTASYNTAIGHHAGNSFNNSNGNVFVGANADVTAASLFNVIAVGQGTLVAAGNTARFGNSATTSYGGWAGWTNVSDGRFKKQVTENVPGLSFINQLRPVTYHFNASALDDFHRAGTAKSLDNAAAKKQAIALAAKEQLTQTGFIAQEVEAVANALGFNFSGVDTPGNSRDVYGLRYDEFVVPLIKAIQQLSDKKARQVIQIARLQKELAVLSEQIKGLQE